MEGYRLKFAFLLERCWGIRMRLILIPTLHIKRLQIFRHHIRLVSNILPKDIFPDRQLTASLQIVWIKVST